MIGFCQLSTVPEVTYLFIRYRVTFISIQDICICCQHRLPRLAGSKLLNICTATKVTKKSIL